MASLCACKTKSKLFSMSSRGLHDPACSHLSGLIPQHVLLPWSLHSSCIDRLALQSYYNSLCYRLGTCCPCFMEWLPFFLLSSWHFTHRSDLMLKSASQESLHEWGWVPLLCSLRTTKHSFLIARTAVYNYILVQLKLFLSLATSLKAEPDPSSSLLYILHGTQSGQWMYIWYFWMKKLMECSKDKSWVLFPSAQYRAWHLVCTQYTFIRIPMVLKPNEVELFS